MLNDLLQKLPFSQKKLEKEQLLSTRLAELTNLHISACPEYASMMRSIGFDPKSCSSYYDIPFLPVRLFKEMELKSIGIYHLSEYRRSWMGVKLCIMSKTMKILYEMIH